MRDRISVSMGLESRIVGAWIVAAMCLVATGESLAARGSRAGQRAPVAPLVAELDPALASRAHRTSDGPEPAGNAADPAGVAPIESVASRVVGLFGFLLMIGLLLVRWSGDEPGREERSVFDAEPRAAAGSGEAQGMGRRIPTPGATPATSEPSRTTNVPSTIT